LFERETRWLIEKEFARTAEDILWRRTKLGLHFSPNQTQKLADWVDREIDTKAHLVKAS